MQGVGAIILAAGQGKRMKSEIPKVLHRIAGAPLICHVLGAVEEAGIKEIIVVTGQGAELVQKTLGAGYRYACQAEPRGTGDAVAKALPLLSPECREVLILCGDTPLLRPQTLLRLIEARRTAGAPVAVLTSNLENPWGYGRILRDEGERVLAIVEETDATPGQKEIKEVNAGTYVFARESLEDTISKLRPENRQGEYYLTDCVGFLCARRQPVNAVSAPPEEIQGINTREELAAAARLLRRRECSRLMEAGVTILDPETTYPDRGVEVGRDTVIYPFTFIEGKTKVGRGCLLGPGTRLLDCTLGDGVEVQYSVITSSTVGDRCQIGPFAYLRPGSILAEGVKVGDFVELKKAVVGAGSKIPHLSYVGDAVIGSGVNVGAGTITCNYDGVQKHETRIEDGAFIGSNTNLVAPVTVGKGAVTGAGSTITRNVPPGALAVERARQVVIPNWEKKKAEKGKTHGD
ncbi:MAG: bifunctional UDP-N-acetylglucosamine diphosphorylase/glucosamine-1-phosphate N-acetyltransferase GlmU [Bacillota bacterium]|jgi:bifunctional UDP-N-acetylglucosamine pyrophosphorylase/glucosamine-1-phosphate N-acetyltransferase|nr:bifunctional UDP-N-acetylglucosamine diphosphorylase/glucosamine-1-phosphate N-acetyltransferase GlmU [Bacillota bacterium]